MALNLAVKGWEKTRNYLNQKHIVFYYMVLHIILPIRPFVGDIITVRFQLAKAQQLGKANLQQSKKHGLIGFSEIQISFLAIADVEIKVLQQDDSNNPGRHLKLINIAVLILLMQLQVLHHHRSQLFLILNKTYDLIHQFIVELFCLANVIESMFVAITQVRIGDGLLNERVDEGICQFGFHQINQPVEVLIVNEEVVGGSIIQGKMVACKVASPLIVDALEVGKFYNRILGGKMPEMVKKSRCGEFFIPTVSIKISQKQERLQLFGAKGCLYQTNNHKLSSDFILTLQIDQPIYYRYVVGRSKKYLFVLLPKRSIILVEFPKILNYLLQEYFCINCIVALVNSENPLKDIADIFHIFFFQTFFYNSWARLFSFGAVI